MYQRPERGEFTGEPGLERTIERPGQAQEGGTARADGVRLREQLIVAGGAWGTATSPAEHSSGWADDLSV